MERRSVGASLIGTPFVFPAESSRKSLTAFDTTPNYTDTFPLPAALAKWKYRAICRVGDAQVRLWSNTVEITVGG